MTDEQPQHPDRQSLHPNLARLAVRYDDIYSQYLSGQLTASAARARMEALVERDDQGVKWGVDPQTGRFVRRTAFGALEFDTPPTSGVLTPDAFTYTAGRSDNPALRLRVFSTEEMQRPAAPRVTQGAHARQSRSVWVWAALLAAVACALVVVVAVVLR